MRILICQVLMLSLLSMNVEGAMDIASDLHSNGEELTHLIDTSSADSGGDADRENNHCEHCCHAHVVSITSQLLATTTYHDVVDYQAGNAPVVINFAQAPPTPPPNV